jgi:hypothetical protein
MKIYGMEIRESEEHELHSLLEIVDPAYWKAIAIGISYLQKLTAISLDDAFTGVYATVLQMEEVMDNKLSHYRAKDTIDFNKFDISVKE